MDNGIYYDIPYEEYEKKLKAISIELLDTIQKYYHESGTLSDEEAKKLAAHIHGRLDPRSIGEIYGLDGVALGAKVYEIRCGKCHRLGGHQDVSDSILGLSREDFSDLLDMAGDMSEEMPPFTGDEAEREGLFQFLESRDGKEVQP